MYTGVNKNLEQRLNEHYLNRGRPEAFTGRYHCYYLLYFEEHCYIINVIDREKEIKTWLRQKKEALIVSFNPANKFLMKK